MKFNFKQTNILIFITLLTIGCSDDFLNDPKPTSSVTEEVIFSTRVGAEAFLSGIQRSFRTQFERYQRTDCGGIYSMYFARSVKGNDLIQGPTWFLYDYSNDNREPTYSRVGFTWDYPYFMINQANSLINGVTLSELPDTDKAELTAQGKTIRAFFYFQLAMEFQHTYSFDATLPAPPIYTELSLEGNPMSTLTEMYDLIISDLTSAVTNLNDTRLGKSYVNQSVASGILARVYLVTGNMTGAANAANMAYGGDVNSVLDAASYGNGFDDITNSEWIWGSPQSSDQSNYYYLAPHAFTDHYSPAYFGTYINVDFADLFSETDVRNLFVHTYENTTPTDYTYLTTTKFIFAFDSDMPLMRTSEMILIESEALLNSNEDQAHNLLYALQLNRDSSAVKSTNTGDALLNEILIERRKELYGEIGVEWFDAKRLRRAIPRTGNHRLIESDLEADDKKLFLKIPQAEIDANDYIDDSINTDR
ncbi:RagB/SusD family nutrient uptake outer membrane protein [Flavicella sp.]|uniref:RagB/SusD family nutrient uptake outer membrane protein n=1 Tax=Flavicella sp. TaxID=2957742 RepID=UPI003016A533